MEPDNRSRLGLIRLDPRRKRSYEPTDNAEPVARERLRRNEDHSAVRASLLRSPLQLHGNEVGNVLRDDAALVELREHEELLIVQAAQLGLFLCGNRIETASPQSFGTCGREHLVEEQLHPYRR
jgi:hypothetical protein